MNAPMMKASLAASASSAKASVTTSAATTTVAPELARRWMPSSNLGNEQQSDDAGRQRGSPIASPSVPTIVAETDDSACHDLDDHRQDHEPEDVVGDGGADHDPRLGRRQSARDRRTLVR